MNYDEQFVKEAFEREAESKSVDHLLNEFKAPAPYVQRPHDSEAYRAANRARVARWEKFVSSIKLI